MFMQFVWMHIIGYLYLLHDIKILSLPMHFQKSLDQKEKYVNLHKSMSKLAAHNRPVYSDLEGVTIN